MLLTLLGCIGLQALPQGAPEGRAGHDPRDGIDTSEPLDTANDGNNEPYADAGGDLVGFIGVVVNLDGSGSYDPDGDSLDYTWSIDSAPGGSNVKLSDGDEETAQLVPDVEGAYSISLVVSDGAYDSEGDVITLTVSEDNGKPVAAAGADQSVAVGATVTLNGGGSSDPDHDPLQYAWTLGTRPTGSGASLSSSSSVSPSFVADVAGVYEATLTVTDGSTTSGADKVRVVAQSSGGGGGGTSSCGCQAANAADGLAAAGLLAAFTAVRARRRRR